MSTVVRSNLRVRVRVCCFPVLIQYCNFFVLFLFICRPAKNTSCETESSCTLGLGTGTGMQLLVEEVTYSRWHFTLLAAAVFV